MTTRALRAEGAVRLCAVGANAPAVTAMNPTARNAFAPVTPVGRTIAAAALNHVTTARSACAPAVSMTTKGALTAMKKNLMTKPKTNVSARRAPVLRLSPTAWAKLLYLRDLGETEIGGFGISAADDLLLVEDVQLMTQKCSWSHVAFKDESVAEFFERQVAESRRPEQFARIWIHTHPGISAEPSLTDEATFSRVFGPTDWAIMFILARGGETYCRLRYNIGPQADLELPCEVDFSSPFSGSNSAEWNAEYLDAVTEPLFRQ
jgi:proteasome lid subunit RPN8/RPN11